ncbi:MAG: benzoate-CoA ligase family protein [Xanthobacteraceae bacterium]
MRANTVVTDQTHRPTVFRFARSFNVAVPFIDRHVEQGRGSRIAIRSVAEDVSYAALAERVARCGNALLGLGVSPGARLLMVVKDCPEFFYAFWGAIKAGIVPVPLNTLLRAEEYKFLIEDSACAALVYSSEFAGEVESALALAVHRPRHVVPIEVGEGQSILSMMGEAPAALNASPASAGGECFWLYSSGSTDRPKGVVHSHRDMVITSQLYGVDVLGIRSDDTCFSAAKLFFAYGLGNAMTFPLWVGATAVLLADRPTAQSTFAMIERFRPTLYFGVPTLYAAQVQTLEISKPNLSSIRLCVSAGEALPPHIFRRWRDLTSTIILDGIGSTEALHIFITNRIGDMKPGTNGRVVPGYDAKILDEKGRPVRQGQIGQLCIRGGSVAQYYWNDHKRRRYTTPNGWLNTGDIFVQDSDGYYVYCGRRDDMLKVNGTWCSPLEIEATLSLHPGVLEAAVVGRADADGLIKPEAWIVLNEERADPAKIERELVQHCKTKLMQHQYPRWFHFVSKLPKTTTGKILRIKLRAAADGASNRSGASAAVA